ncbi:hypothetical protein DFH28DRAFT_1157469 [Melampsora americana]|nr:hypothetical protein DFH28DRAFT_1157469 [Melampsora americana]
MEINRKEFSLFVFFLFPIFTSIFSCVEGAFNAAEDLARAGAEGSDALRSGAEQPLVLAKHPGHESQHGHGSLLPSHMTDGTFPPHNFQPPVDNAAFQDNLAQQVQKMSEAIGRLSGSGSTPETVGNKFHVDPTYSDERPIPQHKFEQEKEEWYKIHKKARLPPLHSEKYDWHVVRWSKALGRGTKKVLGYFFRALWKVISFPFRTIIKDPGQEAELATEIQKPKEAIESVLNKDKNSKIPTHFPFIKEDDMMHRARLIGEQVQEKGVKSIKASMEQNRNAQEDGVISELRELPSYLEAQKNLYQAHQVLLSNRDRLDSHLQGVLNIYQTNAKMQDSMEKIFAKYVDYIRRTEGSKEESLAHATPRLILDHYTPWIEHIPIGPLDLLVREPDFLDEVLKSGILGANEEESLEFWKRLTTHAIGVRELYGRPAEELTRWQNVILQYETKLEHLKEQEKANPSALISEFDTLAKGGLNDM